MRNLKEKIKMDLFAYGQINDLDKIAKDNGIIVPRLRGYRLMTEEEIVTPDQIEDIMHNAEMNVYKNVITSIPLFHPDSNMSEFSLRTDNLKKKYLIQKTVVDKYDDGSECTYKQTIGIRWELIHGKNRKNIKFAIKKRQKAIKEQFTMFNKYVGRDDVLYIHARIGGPNWKYYAMDVQNQPWFLEKVDDAFDCTYCDIYAKINN
jgi:hypothetical protein